ncbi:MAG: hypothetical protein C4541_07485 [Candidatus Auribacter fodinae]|uniref:Uncharacterized protein n=1 Tax=Candidatus Auribacter fodinae TaxID=2093366 RepID=A0A3A4R8W5_9BACT|nr:MAG: hypothetical protein C4541_07485 [Candidatus Auribacter fodinae]
MIQKTIICLSLFIIICFQTGCGRKESAPKPQADLSNEPMVLEKVSEVESGISRLFPDASQYIYPNSTIGFQDTIKDNDDAPDLVQHISAHIMLESSDDIEIVYEYYKQLIPEDTFTIKHKHGKIQGIYCTYFSPHPHNVSMDNVTQLTITQPSRNFSDEMLSSQIKVLKQQRDQYEKMFKLQEEKYANMPNDTPKDGLQNIKSLIDRIDLQVAVLTNKTTLINVLLSVEPREIDIPVKTIELPLPDNDSLSLDNDSQTPESDNQ